MMIGAGELNTLIDIYGKTTSGTGGFKTQTYAKVFSCWAKWVNAHGTDALIANAEQVQKIATVTVYCDSRITENCRVVQGGITYEIVTGIDNIRQGGEWMQFKVRAVVNA